ncbi:hypothetical protein HanHA89_Chr16g0678581 [Helianthus annuus]|nr:hypothetical protein HanHA89_Chr16g0678581 [Helianthus annuus]
MGKYRLLMVRRFMLNLALTKKVAKTLNLAKLLGQQTKEIDLRVENEKLLGWRVEN